MAQDALVKSRSLRRRVLKVTPELILDLLKVDDGVIVNGRRITFQSDPIPSSATALRAGMDEHGNVLLLIQDESFPEIAEGERYLDMLPVYRSEAA